MLSQHRLQIVDHFDRVKNAIDLHTEIFMAYNLQQHMFDQIDEINKERVELIKYVDECQETCLTEYEKIKDKSIKIKDCALFPVFCFTIEYNYTSLILISTDKYLSPEQINCFQAMVQCIQVSSSGASCFPADISLIFSKNSLQFETSNENLQDAIIQSKSKRLFMIQKPASELTAFNKLEIELISALSIRPEAEFLFSNLTNLTVRVHKTEFGPEQVAAAINQFTRHNKTCYVKLVVESLSDKFTTASLAAIINLVNSLQINPSCKQIKIESLNSLFSQSDSDDHSWTNLTELVVTYGSLSVSPSFLKRLPNLVRLELYQHTRLVGNVFQHLINLRFLELTCLSINSFDIFDALVNLEELSIECKYPLSRLEKFANLPKLKLLNLQFLSVDWISPTAFDHLTQLESLTIGSSVQMKLFETGLAPRRLTIWRFDELKLNSAQVTKIEEIEFDGKRITTQYPLTALKKIVYEEHLHCRFEQFAKNLEYLFGGYCSVDFLRFKVQLNSMANLKELTIDLESRTICENTFAGLCSLNKLCLAFSGDKNRIEQGAFDHLSQLRTLKIREDEQDAIDQLSMEAITHARLPRLVKLDLSLMRLFDLKPLDFCLMLALTELTLHSQRTDGGIKSAFVTSNLHILNMPQSQIKKLPVDTFSCLPSLEHLNLSDNKINAIDKGLFAGLGNLRSINLANNYFETIDLSLFDHFFNLMYLDLSSSKKSLSFTCSVLDSSQLFAKTRQPVAIRVTAQQPGDRSLLQLLVNKKRIRLIEYQ